MKNITMKPLTWQNVTDLCRTLDATVTEAWIAEWTDNSGETDGSCPMIGTLDECKTQIERDWPEIAS